MRLYWHKWHSGAAVLACLSVMACQSMAPVEQMGFVVDGGQTVNVGMTRNGAMPADDGVYRVENMGLMLFQQDDGKVVYAWDVMVNVIKQPIQHIQVSQVLNDGSLQLLLSDKPSLSAHPDVWHHLLQGGRTQVWAQRWRGVTAAQEAQQAAWLFETTQDTVLMFKIEIHSASGSTHVLYQPMWVGQARKQQHVQAVKEALKQP